MLGCDLAARGKSPVLMGHQNAVTSASFRADRWRPATGSADKKLGVWETDFRHLLRLWHAASAEMEGSWNSARFLLHWLAVEELPLQAVEAASGLTSPLALGGTTTLLGLQSREERVSMQVICAHHFRACLELKDWDGETTAGQDSISEGEIRAVLLRMLGFLAKEVANRKRRQAEAQAKGFR